MITQIILLQLFWFSFVLIGAAIVLLYRKLSTNNASRPFIQVVSRADGGTLAFILFCLGVVSNLAPIALAYIFVWPLTIVVWWYIALVAIAVGVVIAERKRLRKLVSQKAANLTPVHLILGSLVILFLALEYVSTLHAGIDLYDDTPVHLARIQMFLNTGHISLTDPFMGYNGIIDPRYSTNIMNALQAAAGYILHLPAYKVWQYSAAFYRLMLAGSFYALARTFLPKRAPASWSYMILLLMPIFGGMDNNYIFKYPELPHAIVLAWISLLFIGLKALFERSSYVLFWVAVLLIAATHAISSVGAAAFLAVFLGAALLLRMRVNSKQILMIASAAALLLVPTVVNLLLPVPGTAIDINLTSASGFHAIGLNVIRHGHLVIPVINLKSPEIYVHGGFFDTRAIVVYAILTGYVILLKRIKRPNVRRALLWALALVALEVYNGLLISLVAYAYLFMSSKDRIDKAIIAVAVIFYALVAYNPIILSLLFGHIPLWILARFQDINNFAFLAPFLGLFVLYAAAAKYWNLPKERDGYALFAMLLVFSQVSYYKMNLDLKDIYTLGSLKHRQFSVEYSEIDQLKPLDRYVKNKIIFTNSTSVETMMGMAATGTIGLLYNPQSDQMENIDLRLKCNNWLLNDLSYSNLVATGVNEVVLFAGSSNDKSTEPLLRIAANASYLKKQVEIGKYQAYAVNPAPKGYQGNPACKIPYKQ